MDVRLEYLEDMHAICAYALTGAPEEDAKEKIMAYAKSKSLADEGSVSRLFGRNTYPTSNPEPHGYEFHLTAERGFEPEGDLEVSEIPGGLYAVLGVKNLFSLGDAWLKLLKWVEESSYEPVGVKKGNHGWVSSGFEEHLNWKEEKPPTEWIFKLRVKLKE